MTCALVFVSTWMGKSTPSGICFDADGRDGRKEPARASRATFELQEPVCRGSIRMKSLLSSGFE